MATYNEHPRTASPEAWHGDGREVALLNHIFNLPNLNEIRGKPDEILSEIESYSTTQKFLMNVGQERGQVVVDLIHQSRPKLMVELGGYIGFSAIKFGNAVRAAGGIQYLSFEKSPENAAVAKVLLELAGLDEFVRVVVGPSTQSLRSLAQQKQWTGIDFLFLDHWEELYLPDLKLIEEQDLLKVGSLIVADNTGNPKTEAYLEWVRSTSETKRKISRGSTLESCGSFLYESKSYNFRLPDGTQDGMEVTRCITIS